MAPTTHVSNGTDNDAYIMCATNPNNLHSVPEIVDDFQEFTIIPSAQFLPFETGLSLNQSVYITAFVYNPSTERIERICEAFQVPSDHSVVIGNDNIIRRVEYGKLWIDLDGINHNPNL